MSDTLQTLNRAVIATPADRTVRLVYADALDETGDPADAARAEFVRTQVEIEGTPKEDVRFAELVVRSQNLFTEHWLAWWEPVARAAGLPDPHVPGRRVRDRVARAVGRRRRPRHWPYTFVANDPTVHLADYGLSFRYAAGFPEEVRFLNLDTPEHGPELIHSWGEAMPLTRLSFASPFTEAEWDRVNGPHLARLAELVCDRLRPEVAPLVAESPYLAAVNRLSVNPVGANTDAIRALVWSPAWKRLRSLRFSGRLSPDAVRDLAAGCRLKHLEELDLVLGNPSDLGGPIGEILSDMLQLFMRVVSFPAMGMPRWVEFGPALEALAAAPWVRRLRRLAIRTAIPKGFRAFFAERLYGTGERVADGIPDESVFTLADALNPDKLDTLVLPAAVISPGAQEELANRFGDRIAFD